MAGIAAHPLESMFKAAAPEVSLELFVNMIEQGITLRGRLVDQRRVVRFDKLVEKCLLGLMQFVGKVTKAIPINRGRLSLHCAYTQFLGNR